MPEAPFESNCAQCQGLCCVALAFDAGPHFAFDKAAGERCRHLTDGARCRIHATLAREGLSGCTRYECLGAGARVASEVLEGRSWLEQPALLPIALSAFRVLRDVQELRQLLTTAAQLQLSPEQEEERKQLESELSAPFSAATLNEREHSDISQRVGSFLQSLRGVVAQTGPRHLPVL